MSDTIVVLPRAKLNYKTRNALRNARIAHVSERHNYLPRDEKAICAPSARRVRDHANGLDATRTLTSTYSPRQCGWPADDPGLLNFEGRATMLMIKNRATCGNR
jgi:hypothetical protein